MTNLIVRLTNRKWARRSLEILFGEPSPRSRGFRLRISLATEQVEVYVCQRIICYVQVVFLVG